MYDGDVSESVRLTNADFRKLLMTPRVAPSDEPSATPAGPPPDRKVSHAPQINKEKHEQRKKKKQQYAMKKKEEDEKLAQLALKYRDRAKERREGNQQDDDEDPTTSASGYRAVAPDFKSGLDAAERKKKMILESKYLGGDMEHTHLVKGLDFALLQKVRSEIEEKEMEQELAMEKLVKVKATEKKKVETEKTDEKKPVFRTAMARNLHCILDIMRTKEMKKNELFAPGRMAYVVELDDDGETAEIPTTLIRSKADVPMVDNTSTLSTNDIVINKLTQILSYLRQGHKTSKKNKKYKDGRLSPDNTRNLPVTIKSENLSIYDDIGDYVPPVKKEVSSQSSFSEKKTPYFIQPKEEIPQAIDNAPRRPNIAELAAIADAKTETDKGMALASVSNSYAECYVGFEEMNDAMYDSDEEVDYTKMDNGNKKSVLNRWDFDTQEEYSDYMGQREALPKAAFQFGVKMENGRKTQKFNNKGKNDKAKFDKQWEQIQKINKRKYETGENGSKSKVPKNY